jgi:hypothetical protein
MTADLGSSERPPSLLRKRPMEPGTLMLGLFAVVGAHLGLPLLVLGSQWLLVLLGLAIPVEDRERPKQVVEVMAAEFAKLGKPFDPTRLPQRKVPPVAKRKPTGVVVSADAKEHEKKDEKEKPKEAQASLLDNLVDRSKDFAEDVAYEEEGDPNGIAEGTATTAKAGNIYLGQLSVFMRRNWTVPNNVQNAEKLVAVAAVKTGDDGQLKSVEIQNGSGDPYFDQSVIDAIQSLIQAGASLPEPPADLISTYYGTTLAVRFSGKDLR